MEKDETIDQEAKRIWDGWDISKRVWFLEEKTSEVGDAIGFYQNKNYDQLPEYIRISIMQLLEHGSHNNLKPMNKTLSPEVIKEVKQWIGEDKFSDSEINDVYSYLDENQGIVFPNSYKVRSGNSPEKQTDNVYERVDELYSEIYPGEFSMGEKKVRDILYGLIRTATHTNLKGDGNKIGDDGSLRKIQQMVNRKRELTEKYNVDPSEENRLELNKVLVWLNENPIEKRLNLPDRISLEQYEEIKDTKFSALYTLVGDEYQLNTIGRTVRDASSSMHGDGYAIDESGRPMFSSDNYYLKPGAVIEEKDPSLNFIMFRYEIVTFDMYDGELAAYVKEATVTDGKPVNEFPIRVSKIVEMMNAGTYSIEGRDFSGSDERDRSLLNADVCCIKSRIHIWNLNEKAADLKVEMLHMFTENAHLKRESNALVSAYEKSKGEFDATIKGVEAIKYGNKTPDEVWDGWNETQRKHFLRDHYKPTGADGEKTLNAWVREVAKYSSSEIKEKINKDTYDEVLSELDNHMYTGQYGNGTRVKAKGQKIPKCPICKKKSLGYDQLGVIRCYNKDCRHYGATSKIQDKEWNVESKDGKAKIVFSLSRPDVGSTMEDADSGKRFVVGKVIGVHKN